MGAGASGIGRESRFACAACHTLFNRPINSGGINRCSGYIGEAAAFCRSEEACRTPDMLFPDEFAESITPCSKREGHLYIDGVGIEKIRIAEVQSMDALDEAIQEAMSR